MTLSRYAALALAAASLTACISTEPVPTQDYGFVVLVGEPDALGGSRISDPIAYFLRTSQIGLSETGVTQDNCEIGQIPGSSDPLPGLPYIDAGATVTVGTENGPIVLDREIGANLILYTQEGPHEHSPGTAISATTTGADGGFPAMTVNGTAAPAFTFQDVPVDEDGGASEIVLTWDAPPAAVAGQTTMNVSLRYASDATSLNRQIFCALKDDGSATISALLSDGWHNSQNDLRDALFERVKIDLETNESTRSTLVLFSTYLQTEPAAAPQ